MSQQKQYDKFYAYLDELDQSYGRLADLLRQKLIAADQFDMDRMNAIMREEQAYVLLSRGFEGNIRSHRDSLGLRGETLSEVIEELPEEEQGRFRRQMTRLNERLDNVKRLNERCQKFIETRLYAISKSIRELDKSANAAYVKDPSPKPPPDEGPRLFSKTV